MVADSTGMSVDSLTKMIQKNAEDSKKLNMFQGTLDGLEEADKALVGSGISDMLKIGKDGSVEFDVDSNMAKKMGINSLEELQSMSAEDIKKKIEADAKTLEEQAKQNQSFEDSLKGLKDAFYNIFTIFEPFLRKITKFVQFLNGSVVGKWVLATLALVAFMPKMKKSFGEFKQGASSLVESFKGMSKGKGFLGKVKGFFSGAKPKDDGSLNGADSKDMTPSKSGGGLKSLAQGLAKMGGKNVLKGIGNTALAGPALALMLPGMPTLGLMIAIGAGGALLEFGFKSLASGIASFGNKKNILKGIGAIALAGPALLIASPGIIAISLASVLSGGGLLLAPLFQSLSTGLSILSKNFTNVAKGSIALILVGSAMIPFAVAAKIMTDVDWVSVLTGVEVMSLVVLGLMGLGVLLMGPQILALLVGVGTLIAVGAAMLVASIGLLPAATAFEKLAEINWDGLSNMGSALMSTVPGLLAFSLASMMFLNPLSLLGMIAMTATLGGLAVVMIPLGDAMIKAADGMERFAGGLEKLQQAASNLDFERLEALKDLSMGMAVAGVGGGVLGDQIKKIAEALAMLSNSSGGGSGSGGTKKFEINLKLNGRQLQEIIIDDTEIVS